MKLIASIRNLFLFDAFDERNEYSLKLMEDILHSAKGMLSCKILISTRSEEMDALNALLVEQGFEYRTCKLLSISNDQKEFIQRNEQMQNISEGTQEAFGNLACNLKLLFSTPIEILMFCHLCEKNYSHTETTILNGLVKLYKERVSKKLERRGIKNSLLLIADRNFNYSS